MPTGTTENIDYFKNAPSDATHYVCVGGCYRYLKESHHPNGDVFVIENCGKGWLPDSHICGTIEEYIERQSRNNTRILASQSLKEEQDSEWEYLKGSEKDFIGAPGGTNVICGNFVTHYKISDNCTQYWNGDGWVKSNYEITIGEDGNITSTSPSFVLAVRREVKKTKPTNKVIKVDCAIKSTPTEDKTVQEFQNGQEVLWHKDKAFYVGESKEKGKSVIETVTNQGIHGTTYTQVTVNTASLSPVENKQEIQYKDLKQLKELLDSEINNWFNKLS